MTRRFLLSTLAAVAACGGMEPGETVGPRHLPAPRTVGAQSQLAARFDTSAPLALLGSVEEVYPPEHEPMRVPRHEAAHLRPDRFVQSRPTPILMPTVGSFFEAQGEGFTGPSGSFSIVGVPPDTNGDIGPNHYVQTVNSHITVFDRTGKALYGPVQINTLFKGFGGSCESHNDGDPVVLYDQLADRWVVSQFAIDIPTSMGGQGGTNWFQCVAVSTTPDPTGGYNRYAFQYQALNDYPKMGVWPDGYYQTFNLFDMAASNTPFIGAKICAYDRASMLAGRPATQQCFQTSDQYGGVLPADLDGKALPPAGEPATLLALFDNNNLSYWQFKTDWNDPTKTVLTGPVNLPVPSFNVACSANQTNTCIPQEGTTQQLDALSDRLMFRLAYRNFGNHESFVVSHAVDANGATGLRWYELRMQNGVPAVYQQGTYAPDANFRWLGSTAQDKAGNQVIGFSVSGKAMKPSIHFAGRLADDPPNELARGEATLLNGTGAQLPMSFGLQPLSRWGDYAMLSLDPVDDCTFWFTTEYIKTDGSANWHTEVGSIKMPGCDSPVPPPTSAWVRLTFPENGAIEAGTLTLTGEAASPATLTKLEFLVDGASVGTAVKSPATATWDSTKVADGSHTVAIRATDSAGWSATSQVNVTVQNAASAGGGGGGCPAGTIDLGGGICLPLGCSTAGAMPGWMAIIALGALLMRRRPRK